MHRILTLAGAIAILAAPVPALSETWDVIQFRLSEDCDLATYQQIVADFNAYYADKNYQAQLLLPLHGPTQGVVAWVGRSPSSGAFGSAFDHWQSELAKDGSKVAMLSQRFEQCGEIAARSSWTTVP